MEKLYKYSSEISVLIKIKLLLALIAFWFGHHSRDSNSQCSKLFTSQVEEYRESGNTDTFINLISPNIHNPDYLIELAKYEHFVYQALTEVVQNYSSLYPAGLLAKIDEYLSVYQEEKIRANISDDSHQDQMVKIGENPLLILSLIWRFTNELTTIFEEIQSQPNNPEVKPGLAKTFITDMKGYANWPTQYTATDAMIGLFRVQMVYDLDAEELANGRLFGFDTGRLEPSLIFAIGTHARRLKMHSIAIPWLEFAWKVIHSEERNPGTISLADVERVIMEAMMEHDMELARPSSKPRYYFYNHKLLDQDFLPVEERFSFRKSNFSHTQRSLMDDNSINYWNLCAGENQQTEQEKSQLKCWYDTRTDPALTIYPLKVEQLSVTPYLVRLYDVVGNKAIRDWLGKADSNLKRSTVSDHSIDVGTSDNPRYAVSPICTAVDSLVPDVLPELSKFVEVYSQLSVIPYSSAGPFLITKYSPGGHHNCHMDVFEHQASGADFGNPVATMMFYLDDVPAGGHTAFPNGGFAVKPIKGSAIFWYNLKRNGEPDLNTDHCACPVAVGRKTISNKFILNNDQFLRRPCTLNKDE